MLQGKGEGLMYTGVFQNVTSVAEQVKSRTASFCEELSRHVVKNIDLAHFFVVIKKLFNSLHVM